MVIGIHGAGLSNIIFCQKNTIVIELGSVNFPCYKNLAKILELNYIHKSPLFNNIINYLK